MSRESAEVNAARNLADRIAATLEHAPSFRRLDPATQSSLVRDLGTIRRSLGHEASSDPYALTLDTPQDLARRRLEARQRGQQGGQNGGGAPAPPAAGTPGPRAAATETLAARAGALSDEINFPAFVAGLVHGTFDAIIDATIRQMEAFADLVGAVAKSVEQFTRDNVTPNQVRDWLVQQYPKDLVLDAESLKAGQPALRRRAPQGGAEDEDEPSPLWLADFGLGGEPLTDELIEEQLVPAARRRVGESRLQMLATMVLLGMQRINVKDGSISARVRFRAAAKDKADVNYAVSQDSGGGGGWATRGSSAYDNHATMVSTVGVNVQAESDLKVELFGEVRINFVSETLPLDRFVDQAGVTLMQQNARWTAPPPQQQLPAAPPVGVASPPAAPPPSNTGTAPAAPPLPGSEGGRT